MNAAGCMFLINLCDLLRLKLENNEANFQAEEHAMVCELFCSYGVKIASDSFLSFL